MTIKELLINYKDVELTKEQEKQIKEYLGIKESKKWKPERGEMYFYLDDYGDIEFNFFADDSIDKYKLNTGNFFKTEEDVKYRIEQIKVYNELKNFADENNDEIDWKNDHTLKYHIGLDYEDNYLQVFNSIDYRYIGQTYFSSRELAQQAIEKVGADRIKKYLFGVLDNE